MINIAIEAMAIEIVYFPIKKIVVVHSYGKLPEGIQQWLAFFWSPDLSKHKLQIISVAFTGSP